MMDGERGSGRGITHPKAPLSALVEPPGRHMPVGATHRFQGALAGWHQRGGDYGQHRVPSGPFSAKARTLEGGGDASKDCPMSMPCTCPRPSCRLNSCGCRFPLVPQ